MPGKPPLLPLPLWTVLISALAFVLACLHSQFLHHPDPAGCQPVWMYPSYTKLKAFDQAHTRLADKYGLYLYRDANLQPLDAEFRPDGIPLLFVPGNAGSYRQARSIGSLAAAEALRQGKPAASRLDIYTIDFEEDLSAFHGRTLLDQAEYVNDAIRFILALYNQPDPDHPHPKSVLVVGHSMGGFVARALPALANYVPDSINTLVTLAAPHARPPLAFDASLARVYDLVNTFWRQASSDPLVGRSPVSGIALVSIAGGRLDTLVPGEYGTLADLASPSHGFAAFAYGMANVWTAVDHQAIVWCHQARAALVHALLAVTDATRPGKTRPLEDRMRMFSRYLLSGFEPYEYNRFTERAALLDTLRSGSEEWEEVFPKEKAVDTTGAVNVASGEMIAHRTSPSLFPLPANKNGKLQVFLNSTSAVAVYLCAPVATGSATDMACYETHDDAIPVPFSTAYHTHAAMSGYRFSSGSGDEPPLSAAFLEYDLARDTASRFTHVLVKPHSSVQKAEKDSYTAIVNTHVTSPNVSVAASLFKMALRSVEVKLPGGQATDIEMVGANNPLLSYKVTVTPLDSPDQRQQQHLFSPLVRQYVLEPFESKFHTAVGTAWVSFHGLAAPYVPHGPATRAGTANLHLQIFTPPSVSSPGFVVKIELDWWGSLANLIPRYRTLLIPFGVAVVAAVAWLQVHAYTRTGRVPTFVEGARGLAAAFFHVFLPTLMALHCLLSFGMVRSLVSFLENPLEYLANVTSDEGEYTGGNGFLVGSFGLETILVAPLLVFVSLGATVILHQTITLPMNLIVARLAPRRQPQHLQQEVPTSKLFQELVRPGLGFSVATGFALLLTQFYAPYPLVFTVVVVYMLGLLAHAKYRAAAAPSTNGGNGNSPIVVTVLETLAMLLLWTVPLGVPVVAAWVHTLIEYSPLAPCTSHRSPLALIPIIFLARTMHLAVSTSGSASGFKRVLTQHTKTATGLAAALKAVLVYTAAFALLAGFRKTYFLVPLANLACFFIAGTYTWGCYAASLHPEK